MTDKQTDSLGSAPDGALTGRDALDKARRVVVKIGSSLLVDSATKRIDHPWLTALAEDLAALRARGKTVAVVSSGAIALGRRVLELPAGNLKLEESQAAAAAGQIHLAQAYAEVLRPHGLTVAQILLTLTETEERRAYLNARTTVTTLLDLGAIPVINENDTIATSEIRFGDNDRLAARVAQMISADCLILLSDIDGLYTADPTSNPDARPVPVVREVTPEIEAMAGRVAPKDAIRMGSGGMVTKLSAAKICLGAGCHMVIASGKPKRPISAIESGAQCTWFLAAASPLAKRKQWIAGALRPAGKLIIDAGAARALRQGKSLLPAGVRRVEGKFSRGDTVLLCDENGAEIARGLTAYSVGDADRIKGCHSGKIEEILGYAGRAAMVHADDIALTGVGTGAKTD